MNKMKLDIQFFANASCTVSVTEKTDNTNNSSTFTIKATVTTGSQTFNSSAYMQGSYSGGASGNLAKRTFSINKSDSHSETWTVKVNHKSDGTLDDIKFKITWYVTSSDTSHGTTSKTVSPTDIPRKATVVSAPDFTDEEDPTITYSNPAGDAVSSLKARIASSDNTITYVDYKDLTKTGTSYTFELDDEDRRTLLEAAKKNTLSVRFVVKTVIGTETFTDFQTKKMKVVNADPEAELTIKDINETTKDLTKNEDRFIKYFSNIQYTLTAEAKKESTLSSYNISCGTRNISVSNLTDENLTATDDIEGVDDNTITYSVTDSRGNVSKSEPIDLSDNMIEYVKLTCVISDNKPDIDGAMIVQCSGNYFNSNFGAQDNSLTVQYRYKEAGGEYGDWITIDPSLATDSIVYNGNSYVATAMITMPDAAKNYVFQTKATDKLMSYESVEKSVRAVPVFDWGENDFAVNEDFSVVKNSTFGGNVDINGTLSISGTVLSELLKPQINTLTAYIDSTRNLAITISAANTKYNISLNGTLRNIGTKLVLDDDGIIIGSGVQYVRVSGNVMCQGITGNAIMSILNNTTTISEGYMYIPNTTAWKSISLSPQVIPVSEGDVISMKISDSATGTILISRSTRTYLTVEVVG